MLKTINSFCLSYLSSFLIYYIIRKDLLELKKYILLDIIPYLIYDIQNNKTYCLEELSLKLSMRQLEFLYSCLEFLDKVPRRKWAKIKDYIMFQNQKNN